jgi:hypothetical protein
MTHPTNPTPARIRVLPGAACFALVFALGFVFGTWRTLMVHPATGAGRLTGVVIELPIMLWASWYLCRFVIRRFAVAPTFAARAGMGCIAFALLLIAEIGAGALLFGRMPAEHFALYRDTSYAIGLAAQIAFALMPLIQMRQGSGERS